MPTLSNGQSVTDDVAGSSCVVVSAPDGWARMEIPPGTPVWEGRNSSFTIASGSYKVTSVRGTVFYEETPTPTYGGTTIQQSAAVAASSSYLWAVSKVGALTAIAQALIELNRPALQAPPSRTTPYAISGTTRYVDFTATGSSNAGTSANPYKDMTGLSAGITASARGDGILFKSGTTTTITAALVPPATSGTTPFVFGVYDPASGARITGRIGEATIDCGGSAIDAIFVDSKDYVCVDGLAFQNNGTGNWFVNFKTTSGNGQILNCAATGGGYHFVFQTSGVSNVIEGCRSINAASSGITLYLDANDSTSKVQYCYASGGRDLISVFQLTGSRVFSGTIAHNVCEDNVDPGEYRAGIQVATNGGSPKVFGNIVRRCTRGINVGGTGASGSDFSGMLIENNQCNNNEVGIEVGAARGTWKIWFNTCDGNGSKTGATWVTSNRYGRGIELYGASAAIGARDGQVCFNVCTNTKQWAGAAFPGTEGVGIGLDNNTQNVSVFNNYLAYNEGNAIQANIGQINSIFGNHCVENCIAPESKNVGWPSASPEAQAQILFIQNPGIRIFNNTCYASRQRRQVFGIAESIASPASTYGSQDAKVYNNLLIGFTGAAVLRRTAAGYTTELYNKAANCGSVTYSDSVAPTAPGTGSAAITDADYSVTSGFVTPAVGGACDQAGYAVPGGLNGLNGLPLSYRSPIGALTPT